MVGCASDAAGCNNMPIRRGQREDAQGFSRLTAINSIWGGMLACWTDRPLDFLGVHHVHLPAFAL